MSGAVRYWIFLKLDSDPSFLLTHVKKYVCHAIGLTRPAYTVEHCFTQNCLVSSVVDPE
jgi:hypothetical protein